MPRKKMPAANTKVDRTGAKNARRGRGFGAANVYETLRREILNLTMEPGTLLDETELAARFKLSRSPVREALIRLSAEGLVKMLRNRSSVVAFFDVVAVPSYLDATELLYRVTTRLAAINRSSAQLDQIRQLQKEHESAAKRDDFYEMIRLNHEFHSAIAAASGNTFYIAWTRALLDQGQRILGLYIHSVGDHVTSDVLSDHVAIVRAIEAQDADAAEEAGRRDADIIAIQLKDRLSSKQTTSIPLVHRGASRVSSSRG